MERESLLVDHPAEEKMPQEIIQSNPQNFPRFILRYALFISLIPFLLILALHLPLVQGQVLTYAIHQIEKNAPVNIRIRDFEWQPFSHFRLYDLEIQSSGEKILQSDGAELSYYLSWSWPYLHPLELSLDNPFLRLEKDEAGNWNVPHAKGTPRESSSHEPSLWTRFPWPRVRLTSAVILAYQNGRSVLSIRDVNGTFSLRTVPGPNGPSLKIDLGYWEEHSQAREWKKHRHSRFGFPLPPA